MAKKTAIYAVLIVLFVAIQGTVFRALSFIGTVPLICLEAAVFISMMRGYEEGVWFGAVMGLICDFLSGGRVGANALLFMYIGLAAGYFSRGFFQNSRTIALVFAIGAAAAYGILYYIFGYLVRGEFDVIIALWRVILPSVAYSAVLAVPLYVLLEKVNRWIS